MIKQIIINENRYLDIVEDEIIFSDFGAGVIGENNAEVLRFTTKPKTINGDPIENFTMQILIQVGIDRYAINVVDDEFALDDRFTSAEKIIIAVQFLKGETVKWRSYALPLYLVDSVSDDDEHRNYLTSLDFEIDENGHLIMEWEGGNIDFNLNGNDLEVTL